MFTYKYYSDRKVIITTATISYLIIAIKIKAMLNQALTDT